MAHGPDALHPVLESFDAARHDLVEAAMRTLLERHPEWETRWGPRGRAATRRDLEHHLDFIRAAAVAGEPAMFARYSVWLANVLAARRVSPQVIAESFEVLARLLESRLGKDAAVFLSPVSAGVDALSASPLSPSARAPLPPEAEQLLGALLAGDRRQAQEVLLGEMRKGRSIADVGDKLVQPVMEEVGRLWQQNIITVAQEHLATAIMQTIFVRAFAASEFAAPQERRALFACVEGNQHNLGLRVVADTFELAGWDVKYLGADVPTRDLVAMAKAFSPDLVGLSLSLPQQVPAAQAAIVQLREELRDSPPHIVVGGLATNEFDSLWRTLGADAWHAGAAEAFAGVQPR